MQIQIQIQIQSIRRSGRTDANTNRRCSSGRRDDRQYRTKRLRRRTQTRTETRTANHNPKRVRNSFHFMPRTNHTPRRTYLIAVAGSASPTAVTAAAIDFHSPPAASRPANQINQNQTQISTDSFSSYCLCAYLSLDYIHTRSSVKESFDRVCRCCWCTDRQAESLSQRR